MGLGEMLEFIGDGPSQKFTSSLIKNIKCSGTSDRTLVAVTKSVKFQT